MKYVYFFCVGAAPTAGWTLVVRTTRNRHTEVGNGMTNLRYGSVIRPAFNQYRTPIRQLRLRKITGWGNNRQVVMNLVSPVTRSLRATILGCGTTSCCASVCERTARALPFQMSLEPRHSTSTRHPRQDGQADIVEDERQQHCTAGMQSV